MYRRPKGVKVFLLRVRVWTYYAAAAAKSL